MPEAVCTQLNDYKQSVLGHHGVNMSSVGKAYLAVRKERNPGSSILGGVLSV